MFGGKFQFVALFGERSQFEVAAEIVRAKLHGLSPAGDALGQRTIDIVEGLLGGRPRVGIARSAVSGRKPAGPVAGSLVSKQRNAYSKRDMKILRIETAWPRGTDRARPCSHRSLDRRRRDLCGCAGAGGDGRNRLQEKAKWRHRSRVRAGLS